MRQNIYLRDRQLKTVKYALLVVLSVITLQLFMVRASFAAPFGRSETYGYFDDKSGGALSPYPDSRGPVITNDDYNGGTTAIPSSVKDVNSFYAFLQSRYGGAQNSKYLSSNPATAMKIARTWNKTGVGFIVNTMLGRDGSAAHRNLNATDWKDLKDRLDFLAINGSISFGGLVDTSTYGDINTYYQYPNNDVAWYYSTTEVSPGIVFKYNGKVVYALLYSCANPLGDLPGLPDVKYDLTPSVTTDHAKDGVVSPEDTVNVMPSVNNKGNSPSQSADWEVSEFFVKSGASYPTGIQTNNTPPAAFYGPGTIKLDGGNQAFPTGNTLLKSDAVVIPDDPVGTRICFSLSIHGYSQSSTDWIHSDPFCVVLGKKPMVQIWGGDLQVGSSFNGLSSLNSSIDTSTTTKSGTTYGSWVEYGVFAPSSVAIASLSGLAGGNSSSQQKDWSKLTFANQPSQYCPAGSTTQFGCYDSPTSLSAMPDVEGYFFTSSTPVTPGGVNLAQAAPGVYVYNHSGNLTISAATIQKGHSYVVRASGTITITGDISYSNAQLYSLSDIPQLVLIGKNIQIDQGVKNVDAWLVAQGTSAPNTGILDTCDISGTYSTALTDSICSNPLRVNGPVMAQHLWLRRTAGANAKAASGDPAEVLNLRPDAYLWALSQVQGGAKAQTAFTKELPPRY